MRIHFLLAAIIAFAVTFSGPLDFSGYSAGTPVLVGIGAAKAQTAARNTARRTSRRTSRRVARRHSVAGCAPYNAYYNCGGVYYRPVIENGTTVYVVVNP
jgi:hypothetical protein